jgi:peptidoglycan/LPS O-acetylase OafA/YrhL
LNSGQIVSFNKTLNPLAFFTTCWFDAFGFGILAAYLHFHQNIYNRIRPVVENKLLQACVIVFALLYVTNIIPKPEIISNYFFPTVPAILFSFIVLSASTGNFVFNLEYPLLKRIGRYSYGVYIFHAAVAQLLLLGILKLFSSNQMIVFEVVYPVLTILMVILISALSYELYEKKFLKMKKKFTLVQNQKI